MSKVSPYLADLGAIAPEVILTLVARDGHAWIDVEDAGEGIAPQWVDRLQEAFTRGDSSRAGPGSGLGLAIVRQVATRLGGTVSFERHDGRQHVRVTLAR